MTKETCLKFLQAYKDGMEDMSNSASQRRQLKKNFEMMKKHLAEARGFTVEESKPAPKPKVKKAKR